MTAVRLGILLSLMALGACSLVFPSDDYVGGEASGGGGFGAGSSVTFEEVCARSDVARCMAFDDQASVDDLHSLETCDQSFVGCHGTVDGEVSHTGAGSLRMRLPAEPSGDQDVPSLGVNFTDGSINEPPTGPYDVTFGTGDTIFISWRQRITAGMLAPDLGQYSWYSLIVAAGDRDGVSADQASPFFIGVGPSIGLPAVKIYANLWRSTYCALSSEVITMDMFGNEVFQPETGCTAASPGRERCVDYVPDEWMSFQLGVTVGTWGSESTRLRLWVAREGQPPTLVIDEMERLCAGDESGPIEYGKVWLDPGVADRTSQPQDNFIWYDDLVISESPVLDGT